MDELTGSTWTKSSYSGGNGGDCVGSLRWPADAEVCGTARIRPDRYLWSGRTDGTRSAGVCGTVAWADRVRC